MDIILYHLISLITLIKWETRACWILNVKNVSNMNLILPVDKLETLLKQLRLDYLCQTNLLNSLCRWRRNSKTKRFTTWGVCISQSVFLSRVFTTKDSLFACTRNDNKISRSIKTKFNRDNIKRKTLCAMSMHSN